MEEFSQGIWVIAFVFVIWIIFQFHKLTKKVKKQEELLVVKSAYDTVVKDRIARLARECVFSEKNCQDIVNIVYSVLSEKCNCATNDRTTRDQQKILEQKLEDALVLIDKAVDEFAVARNDIISHDALGKSTKYQELVGSHDVLSSLILHVISLLVNIDKTGGLVVDGDGYQHLLKIEEQSAKISPDKKGVQFKPRTQKIQLADEADTDSKKGKEI